MKKARRMRKRLQVSKAGHDDDYLGVNVMMIFFLFFLFQMKLRVIKIMNLKLTIVRVRNRLRTSARS